jgi:hypothetical protein
MMEHPEARPPLTIFDVIRDVFRDFRGFAHEFLTEPRPPAMLLIAWLLGMDAVAGAIELEYAQQGHYLVDNWFHAWLRIMGMGVIGGFARYWLMGTIFHGVVRLAGGRGEKRTSRYIFLYSAIPVVIVDLLIKVMQMIYYGNEYFIGQTSVTVDAFTAGLMLGAYIFTARLCYQGMRELTGADQTRSILLIAGAALAVVGLVALVAA